MRQITYVRAGSVDILLAFTVKPQMLKIVDCILIVLLQHRLITNCAKFLKWVTDGGVALQLHFELGTGAPKIGFLLLVTIKIVQNCIQGDQLKMLVCFYPLLNIVYRGILWKTGIFIHLHKPIPLALELSADELQICVNIQKRFSYALDLQFYPFNNPVSAFDIGDL